MPPSSRLRVAAAQIASAPGDLDANLRKHLDAIDAARAAGVELLLFPELSLTGHGSGAQAQRLALRRDDPRIATLARASGPLCAVFGAIEEAAAAQFHNAAFAVRDGALLHVHRKINLATYGRLEDGKFYAAGQRVVPFEIGGPWRAASLICADTWNPPLVHLAALQGATLLLVAASSAIEAVGEDFDNPSSWDLNLRFHALTYGLPVVMANRVGAEGDLRFWGGSRIVGPDGRPLAVAGDAEALLTAELDYAALRRARTLLPTVRDANAPLLARELARVLRATGEDTP